MNIIITTQALPNQVQRVAKSTPSARKFVKTLKNCRRKPQPAQRGEQRRNGYNRARFNKIGKTEFYAVSVDDGTEHDSRKRADGR